MERIDSNHLLKEKPRFEVGATVKGKPDWKEGAK
jgi:hypothetical protein